MAAVAIPSSNAQEAPALPLEVVTCLQNARFLHLATCDALEPHVSLMNYTYLPCSPWTTQPAIVMTTPPSSRKTSNLLANPRVSLLVHDWVTHRPPTLASSGSPPTATSGLASLLLRLNTAELSRISVTISGTARMVGAESEEETWFKARHLENNTFEDPSENFAGSNGGMGGGGGGGRRFEALGADGREESGDGGRGCYIEGDEVRVIVVNIRGGRTVDWKGGVNDWTVTSAAGEADSAALDGLVNGHG